MRQIVHRPKNKTAPTPKRPCRPARKKEKRKRSVDEKLRKVPVEGSLLPPVWNTYRIQEYCEKVVKELSINREGSFNFLWKSGMGHAIMLFEVRKLANRVNYDKEMQAVLNSLTGSRPTLLLHACCAPCSSAVLEQLNEHFALSILYYNPNIDPPAEYHRREAELERFVREAGYRFPVIELPYDPAAYYEAVRGLENEPEKGGRCTVCYRLRLEETARYAAGHGFEWFCTTLSISPLKDPVRINDIGQELAARYGVRFLPSEFRKREGYKRSLTLSTEYGLYRQDYCGCVFSRKAREAAQ